MLGGLSVAVLVSKIIIDGITFVIAAVGLFAFFYFKYECYTNVKHYVQMVILLSLIGTTPIFISAYLVPNPHHIVLCKIKLQ
ncbi:hypothetical protein QTN25_009093 [Entamoeba marina]